MTEVAPSWHRNPRRERFSVRFPDLGLDLIALTEWFYEHPAPLHRHSLLQVLVLIDGGLRLGFDDGSHWKLQPGEGVVFPAGILHQPGPAEDKRQALLLDVRLTAESSPALHRWLAEGSPRRWRCDPVTLAASIDRLARLAAGPGRIDQAKLMHAIWGLFVTPDSAPIDTALAGVEPATHAPDTAVDQRLLFLESIMHRELEQPYDAERLAHAIQLSVGQMNRLFRIHRGTTPMRRLQEMRLEQARQYLANSTLSVQQVARRCGFINPIHFTKRFRDAFGQTPREYRKTFRR